MNRFIFLLIALLSCSGSLWSQKQTWYGNLDVGSAALRLVFHVDQEGKTYTTTMDSPDQGVTGMPTTSTSVKDGWIIIRAENIGMTYAGKLYADSIAGTFSQGGFRKALSLYKTPPPVKEITYNRPQTPQTPFNYSIDTVYFTNPSDKVTLHGVLTRPATKKSFPLAVLISGSGTQDLNSTVMHHQPFWVIADALTRQGIAVFRFDDRGAGKSKGNPAQTTSATIAEDVAAAIATLRQQYKDFTRIGVIGHSQGGSVAIRLGAEQRSPVDFMILLAAPGLAGTDIIVDQTKKIGREQHLPDSVIDEQVRVTQALHHIIMDQKDSAAIAGALAAYSEQQWKALPEEQRKLAGSSDLFMQYNASLNNPAVTDIISFDPAPLLPRIKCPVLILNGELDIQVDARLNTAAILSGIRKGGNKNVAVKTYPYLNHLFQYAVNGSVEEYEILEETFNEAPLEDMIRFIRSLP